MFCSLFRSLTHSLPSKNMPALSGMGMFQQPETRTITYLDNKRSIPFLLQKFLYRDEDDDIDIIVCAISDIHASMDGYVISLWKK